LSERHREFWLRFWGTRGSLPAPRPSTNIYGGNTPCLEIRAGGVVYIFDAGSGIRALGAALQKEFGAVSANIFFTHYHWDHIHGFPFFSPAYSPGNRFAIFGEPRGSRGVREILAGQMAMPYFPVPIEAMRAHVEFCDVGPGTRLQVGPAVIRAEALNHPGRALSYRIEYRGRSIVYATDNEHGADANERLIEHARGSDILVYDAAYTDAEWKALRKGWGHSTWQEAIKVARAAGVKKLLLFHHEPSRDDRALATIERRARGLFRNAAAAREGRIYRP